MNNEEQSAGVPQIVDHLFRREAGRLVSILTRRFGPDQLQLAEDVVQDALVKAMQLWPLTGVPGNPSAWLLQTARNRAFDLLRRDSVWRQKQQPLVQALGESDGATDEAGTPQFEEEIRDSQLRMMFVCCHPRIPIEAQLALILKTLCGFGEREIASALLVSEAAVAKRLVRARQELRAARLVMDVPPPEELAGRLETVLHALYLLFNEGYKASHGAALLREDLCAEALRLAELLAQNSITNGPSVQALLALMRLNAARLPARASEGGSLHLLAEQDRRRWDRAGIGRGMAHLEQASRGTVVTRYHLEAGIAACHALAPEFAATDWRRILWLYDELLKIDDSPIVALNRAVALAQVEGPSAGLAALDTMKDRAALEQYYLLHATEGQLRREAGETAAAAQSFRRALELAALPAERALLEKRLAECGG